MNVYVQPEQGSSMKTLTKKTPRPARTFTPELDRRLQKLLETPITFIHHSSFEHPEVAETLLNAGLPASSLSQGSNPNPYLSKLGEVPLLKPNEEYQLFARMNFLKYQAKQLLEGVNPRRCSVSRLLKIEALLAESVVVRNHLLRANLRLVVSLARKFADQRCPFEDLVSEGHLPLIRAIELFDFGRGFRFSTYATWAIRNHLVRVLQEEQKKNSRFQSTETEILEEPESPETSPEEVEKLHESRKKRVAQLLNELPDRERQIVSARFGLTDYGREQSLSEIGDVLGISKERVRQLTIRAIDRLGAFSGGRFPTASPDDGAFSGS